MNIADIITTISLLVTLGVSIFALYKAFKVTPKEIKSMDADLSQRYLNLAESSFDRATKAEAKIIEYEAKIKLLEGSIGDHAQEIKKLKEMIAEQETELNQLRKKIIAQDVELIELKKIMKQENKNA